jgi:hypothetical protein
MLTLSQVFTQGTGRLVAPFLDERDVHEIFPKVPVLEQTFYDSSLFRHGERLKGHPESFSGHCLVAIIAISFRGVSQRLSFNSRMVSSFSRSLQTTTSENSAN